MCGIVGIFNVREQSEELRRKALDMSRRIRHRGPDWSGIFAFALYDAEKDAFLIARDPVGVIP